MDFEDTITAIATPNGIGALAIIRISGKNAFLVFEKIIKEKKKFIESKEKTTIKYLIYEKSGKSIDEVIAVKYNAPKTYTGENLIEIISHGGMYTVKKIIEEIIKNGARIAQKGEFTKRAFLNGKIDLMKAEAIDALIKSKNETEYNIAINLYDGSNRNKLKQYEEIIKEEISYIEAEIEFEDEVDYRNDLKIKNLIQEIDEEIYRIEKIRNSKRGIEVSIIGPSNAGKSSLFNFLVGYERSIVNKQKGTTRDKISELIEIRGKEIVINDTAGIRKTNREVEKKGQEITIGAIKTSSLVLWVTDISKALDSSEIEYFKKIKKYNPIVVLNKIDLIINKDKEKFYKNKKVHAISIKERKNIKNLIDHIDNKIEKLQEPIPVPFVFLNNRQKETAMKINLYLKDAVNSWNNKEIAAYYLNKSLNEMEKIFGFVEKEEIIDRIFNNFCIGK